MYVIESIRITLMLLSYVMQKTGRLTFDEKCKILEFIGELVKRTEFTPRLSDTCISDTKCIDQSENR